MRERDCQRGRETYSARNRVSEMESQRERETETDTGMEREAEAEGYPWGRGELKGRK